MPLFAHLFSRSLLSCQTASILRYSLILLQPIHFLKQLMIVFYPCLFLMKLLGELLLERHNFSIMTKYIADAENLKLIMNLLKSEKKQIAFEAFHCFKVIKYCSMVFAHRPFLDWFCNTFGFIHAQRLQ